MRGTLNILLAYPDVMWSQTWDCVSTGWSCTLKKYFVPSVSELFSQLVKTLLGYHGVSS